MRERKLAEAGYRSRHEDMKRDAALQSRIPPAEVGNFYSREEEEPLLCLWRFRDCQCSKKSMCIFAKALSLSTSNKCLGMVVEKAAARGLLNGRLDDA